MSHLSNVKTDRTTLHVRDDGDGAPLVMLHGWPESSYRWEPVLPYLGPGFRLVRPDLRGLGDSARTLEMEAYQKAELAKDVIELLDTLGVERFGLVGHDWGGAVAQEIAIAAPERIMRLAIMNIHLLNNAAGYAAAAKVHASRLHRAYWYQYFMQTPGLCEVLLPGNEERWLRVFLRGKDKAWAFPPDAIAEYIRCYSIAGTPTTGANYYRAMHLDAKRWGGLRDHRFDMPTLLLWGMHDPGRDSGVPDRSSRLLRRRASRAHRSFAFSTERAAGRGGQRIAITLRPVATGSRRARHFRPGFDLTIRSLANKVINPAIGNEVIRMQTVQAFLDSTELMQDGPALHERLARDGYLFVRGLLPKEAVLRVRTRLLQKASGRRLARCGLFDRSRHCEPGGCLQGPGGSLYAGVPWSVGGRGTPPAAHPFEGARAIRTHLRGAGAGPPDVRPAQHLSPERDFRLHDSDAPGQGPHRRRDELRDVDAAWRLPDGKGSARRRGGLPPHRGPRH